MNTPPSTPPLLACVHTIERAVDEVVACDPIYLSARDQEEALVSLATSVERATELLARLLAASGEVADAHGHRDPAAWLAHRTRSDGSHTRRLHRLGRSLRAHPALEAAVRSGAASTSHAHVASRALADLPDDLDAETRALAEKTLVEEAAHLTPRQLARVGHRILEVVDPGTADAHEQRVLERQERRAAMRGFLRTRANGDGTTDVHARISDAAARRLMRYLEAHTNPRRQSMRARETGSVDPRPYDRRLGAAFEAFLEQADPARLPAHGGAATQIVVTVSLDSLRTGLGTALLDGDQPITAGHARRLACTAHLVPVVLGTDSEVLDLGRAARLYSPAQRTAMRLRQPTCRAEGCDIPSTWCEAHHAGTPWAAGGSTELADGLLLCSYHHHRAHDHRYAATSIAGRLRFTRRT